MSKSRFSDHTETKPRRDPAVSRRRALLAIPALGVLVLILLWTVIFARLSVEKEATYREAMASAAILSAALEQHTVKAIHQVDQITRFVKYEFEKTPHSFDLASTVEKGVVQSETLVQVSLIDEHGTLIANTAELNPKRIDLSDREHFKVHEHENDDQLFISKPVLGRVSGHWTLQMTRRLNHPDGSFAGVVVVSEDPSYFTSDFYNNAAIGREGVIAVISDNGAVLARRTGSVVSANGAFSASGSYPTSEHVSGTYVDSIDNVTRIVSYRHIDGYPLGVLVGLSQAEEFADYNHTRNVYLLMAGFISLAMLSFFAVATGLIGKLLGREREMTHLVEYDLLTGLRNRYATLQTLRHDVAQPANLGRLAILFIDLDNFKTVNDTLGHNAGDIVLQMTASRLATAVGDGGASGGALSRIGGDEFVVVIKGDDVEKRAVALAEAAAEAFAKPFEVRGSSFVLHASIGIALYSVANESEIDLLKKADLAMYSAKDAGKNCYQFYSPQLSHRADHLMKWEQQLRVALAEGQLFLAYQPKIDLTRRCITGFEALVRWNHPQHGLIPANEFIPVAESTGLIVPIGDFVIETACRQLAQWQQQGYDTLSLAVNISAVQFWRGDLYETISHAIEESGISARRLELEITETAMMEYPELVSEKIFALKRLGVRIALDDFGTGYSSLSYLNRFSVDTLKVDRSFIQAIPGDRSVCVMVTAIVNLARSLGLTVVVEGTETEEQIAWLAALGHIEAQGFLFSRPVPVDAIAALLERFGVCGQTVRRPAHATDSASSVPSTSN
ncbi:bifunctional diguanylate cyclase/phosphodiesterase [Paraburkholderia sp. 22099]|uniref:Diguanylate cyclase (GGDEF)-like protein n=1 Tax=Paraburkholderia terricola TaxID=169427 RepID=A0A1M6QAY8_9BURK|nr:MULTISPECIES: EAL domain-containing protein [Paraburkholderia]ORC47073.1 dGTP triphosphohydrolase [Burkholderia sp. A27]AXE91730.1 dGTP triphosphohydrolase [Paraburkholderia terricola]MDR6411377.1 diguanylate cyclase (GGDEF)-like protein [Paraburkholderia terricola]MDR6445633.1 diguanylate cyclase (GGDEF)-like protein [Paraburkholderia terricola]MDR6483383.1 diguanylate cyclase (GGDEF)-like protein [Paraburkholderia terricola]